MALGERIDDVAKLRSWKDRIPFHYEYSAGTAGEKFLRGLKDGKILASRCAECGKKYVPPKAYCVDCFKRVSSFRDVGPDGEVAALTESYVDFDGSRREEPALMAFITFPGTTGGLVHRVSGRGVEIGSRVTAKFEAKSRRTGSLLDIRGFVVRPRASRR